jgi:hypothetical protein
MAREVNREEETSYDDEYLFFRLGLVTAHANKTI